MSDKTPNAFDASPRPFFRKGDLVIHCSQEDWVGPQVFVVLAAIEDGSPDLRTSRYACHTVTRNGELHRAVFNAWELLTAPFPDPEADEPENQPPPESSPEITDITVQQSITPQKTTP